MIGTSVMKELMEIRISKMILKNLFVPLNVASNFEQTLLCKVAIFEEYLIFNYLIVRFVNQPTQLRKTFLKLT